MSLFHSPLLNEYDPFDHFRDFFKGNYGSTGNESNTQMDWKRTHHSHIFEIDLLSFTKEDVNLEVHENGVLCIKAEKKQEQDDENEEKSLKWHCRERRNNGVSIREFRLPENVKIDDIKASMHDGVLKITVKGETKKRHKHHKKEVKISEEGGEEVASPKGIERFVCCKT